MHGQDAIVVGLGPRQDHGSRWQTLFTPKRFAGFQFEVNLIGTFLGLLAAPPNAVEIVLFLLLPLRDLGSKMVIGVGAEFAEIDLDFG
ncbi:MAG: hypothetical protein WBY66_10120 [Candidatus Acidiferrales bacterium]